MHNPYLAQRDLFADEPSPATGSMCGPRGLWRVIHQATACRYERAPLHNYKPLVRLLQPAQREARQA